ncbi:MAG: hypothetical protein ACOCRK_02615 [bacterium]
MKNKKTNFIYGFSVKGKRRGDVGEDLVGIYTAPETWDEPTYEGTPVNFDTANPGDLAITEDGGAPDALLFDRVDDELSDLEWVTGEVLRDEVSAGNKVTVVLAKKNGIIETELLDETNTPDAGDDIYVEGGNYSNTDPTAGDGEVIGKCLKVVDGVATIILK